jgi:ubiquinone/menaquinone biosynthesis C-methylase UbiE
MTRLVGVDSSRQMMASARIQTEEMHLSDRVEFHIMDALQMLEFPRVL